MNIVALIISIWIILALAESSEPELIGLYIVGMLAGWALSRD